MENSLKQRIVGAVVLIALAVIFLPSILKEKTNQAPFQTKIPAKPIESIETKLSEETIQKNKQTQQALDNLDEKLARKSKTPAPVTQSLPIEANQNSSITQQSTANETAHVKSKPKDGESSNNKAQESLLETMNKNADSNEVPQTIGEQFKDAAWVIQIASLSSKENAIALVEKLKKAGHKAYRRKAINKQGKSILRVFVGPYIKKSGAKKALPKINEVSSLSGIVLPFDPINH
jgi:DedD protein